MIGLFLLQASFFPAIGQGSDSTFVEIKKSTIISYEFFVNNPVTPDPSSVNTLPEDVAAAPDAPATPDAQKPTAIETASTKAEDQMLSRSLGRSVSEEDVELLTRVIHGEARGEEFEGQVAVGAVVLNRVKDPRFPDTIKAVIYQSGAFTAVDDKQIHLHPNAQSYKAAEAALSGQDPTNGALFYYNPRLATDKWIKSRAVVKRIGNHIFSI
jgi:N-acetylmuramoyl-L-alanine amidase